MLFPACAGVILGIIEIEVDDKAFPRVCGGDPRGRYTRYCLRRFSPRVRG